MRFSAACRTLGICVLAYFAIGAACGGEAPDETRAMSINGGNGQQAAVGTAVSIAPSVKVLNSAGTGVAGISVTFAAATGGGAVTDATQTTNSSGVATVGSWTVGTTLGPNSLTATATGTTGGPITFSATAVAGPAKNIVVNTGNNQNVMLGSAVPTLPAVLVTDQGGNPVSGAAVTFAIATGGGTITGGSQTTNASGIAAITSWTPGTVGANTLTATSTGLTGSPVTFTATAALGPASKLTLKTSPSATAVNRAAFGTQPAVQISDANGNAIAQAGTVVTASITTGGGTLGGTLTATTSASGTATFTNLSISGTVGARTVSFAAGALTAITASVTTTAGVATTIAIEAGNTQTASVSTAVPIPPSVIVKDADANPVSGTGVTFTVLTGGGSVTVGTATTAATGIAAVGSWVLGPTPGANSLRAASTGLTGSPVTFNATATAAATLTYGSATEKIRLLDPAATFTPTITLTNAGTGQPVTAGTYTSRATSVATVDASGKITAVGAGQTWIAAEYQTKLDSVFILVTTSATGPVLRTDVTNYVAKTGDALTINFTLDPKTTLVGSAVVTIGFESHSGVFSLTSFTVPTQTTQPIANNVDFGVYRSTVASGAGISTPVVMGQLKLSVAGAAGTSGWLTFSVVGIANSTGGDIAATTTSTRYPIIVR